MNDPTCLATPAEQPAEGARSRKPLVDVRMRLSLKVSLLVVTIATVLLTALAVHLPWSYTARADMTEMVRQVNEEIIVGIRRQVQDVIDSAISRQRAVAGMIDGDVIDFGNEAKRDAFFLALVKENLSYSFVAFGTVEGNFYGAQRRDDHNLAAITSTWSKESQRARRSERHFVGDGRVFAPVRVVESTNDYYPPARQWYKKAAENPGADAVTDAYMFANSQKPGINTAVAVTKANKLFGVVTIAIELERISRYLRGLTVGKNGTAFIANSTGHLVAHRETASFPAATGSTTEALTHKLENTPSPLLRVAERAMRNDGIAIADVTAPRELLLNQDGERYFVTLAPSGHHDWIIGTVIPESDFTDGAKLNNQKLIVALLLTVVLTSIVAVSIARRLFVAPIDAIIEQTRHIERFELQQVRHTECRIIEINQLSAAVERMSLGLASYGKYLPTGLVNTLFASGMKAELSGENRTMTIFFMDLAGFTTISEAMGPRMVPFLGRYFSDMSDVVEENRGTIDKYIGDAVMAFWGAPSFMDDHGSLACRTALQCLRTLEGLRAEWPEEWRHHLSVRIGINSGRVIVGNIGSASRLNYTVVGDPVNLASRLEGTCKIYGVDCIIGQNTYELAKYDIVARRLDTATVKGRQEPVAIYELLAMADEAHPPGHFDWIHTYEEALNRYAEHDWHGALEEFRRVIEMRGGDKPSEVFVARCEEHLHPGRARAAAPALVAPPARQSSGCAAPAGNSTSV